MTRLKTFLVSALALAGTSGIAMAQETYAGPETVTVSPYYDGAAGSYDWSAPALQSGIGVDVGIGGGVGGFVDSGMQNLTSTVQGLWNVRIGIGTHVPIGLDLKYLGSATGINSPLGAAHGDLIGTTAEADLRWNILPHEMFNPYVFGGVGWTHYDVTNTTFNLSDNGMNNSDNLAEFPVGLGLAFRGMGGMTIDLRGAYHFTTDQNLVLKAPFTGVIGSTSSSDFRSMDSWEATAQIGYEF